MPQSTAAAVDATLDQISRRYDASVARLREAVAEFVAKGKVPDPSLRQRQAFSYPELRIRYSGEERGSDRSMAFGRLSEAGARFHLSCH